MRTVVLCLCALSAAACTTFPSSVEEGIVDINDVTSAIELRASSGCGGSPVCQHKDPPLESTNRSGFDARAKFRCGREGDGNSTLPTSDCVDHS